MFVDLHWKRIRPLLYILTPPTGALMSRIPGLVALTVLWSAGVANAQECSGVQSFAGKPVQVFGAATFDSTSRTFGVGLRLGGRGTFGEIELGSMYLKPYDASSLVVGTAVAYQVGLNAKGTIQFCPAASLGFGMGPKNIDAPFDTVDYSSSSWMLGGAIGVLSTHTSQIDVIPTVSLGFVHTTQKLSGPRTAMSVSHSFELLDLGVGLVHGHQFSLKPILSIPIGLPGGTTAFTMALFYSLGHTE